MEKVEFVFDRLTKCDTGQRLNPLMHIFLFVTLVFSIGFLFHVPSATASILYIQTAAIGGGAINTWGLVALVTLVLHTIGMLIRGKYGIELMRISVFGGFYLWLWAAVVYLSSGFLFQFFAAAVPNLAFWAWYAWQWRRRYKNKYNPDVPAFVN